MHPCCCCLGKIYKFSNKLWCIFCSVRKVGGAQRPRFQVGGARASPPPSPPTSLIRRYAYLLIDAVPIGLQDLNCIRSFFGGVMPTNFRIPSAQISFMRKVEGAQPPPVFKLGGGSSPRSPPAPSSLLMTCIKKHSNRYNSKPHFRMMRPVDSGVWQRDMHASPCRCTPLVVCRHKCMAVCSTATHQISAQCIQCFLRHLA